MATATALRRLGPRIDAIPCRSPAIIFMTIIIDIVEIIIMIIVIESSRNTYTSMHTIFRVCGDI